MHKALKWSVLLLVFFLSGCNWFTSDDAEEEDIVVYDVYLAIINGDGGVLITGKEQQYITLEEDPIFPVYEKEGYVLAKFTRVVDNQKKEIYFTATYVVDEGEEETEEVQYDVFQVLFDANGGTLIEGVEIQYIKIEDDPIFPLYEKDMAEFIGFEKVVDMIAKQIHYTAIYEVLTIRQISSFDLLEEITFGWNYVVGNEEHSDTGRIYDLLLEKNINAVAIPARFYRFMNEDFVIDEEYLLEIQEKVDEALKRDMFAMICFYDSPLDRWSTLDYRNFDRFLSIVEVQVAQVASFFQEYDERLLLSFIAEPRDYADYLFDNEAAMILNIANERFVEIVRSQGGNNSYRHLIITPGASAYSGLAYDMFLFPEDDYLIARVHAYAPFGFVHEDTMLETSWEAKEMEYKLEILSVMQTIHANFIEKGIPVLIGEFGSRDKQNDEDRAKWLEYYISCATSFGITCFIWDAANVHLYREYTFSLIDRFSYEWVFPAYTDMLESLMKDGNIIPFYEELINSVQSIDEPISIPTTVTNRVTKEVVEVDILYDAELLEEIDGSFYAKQVGEILFRCEIQGFVYYYRIVVVPGYELLSSDFTLEVRKNDQGVLQCFITSFGHSIMRVDYDWYSSDESILTVNQYSSISIRKDGIAAILAIHKETKAVGIVEVEILNGEVIRFTSKIQE